MKILFKNEHDLFVELLYTRQERKKNLDKKKVNKFKWIFAIWSKQTISHLSLYKVMIEKFIKNYVTSHTLNILDKSNFA